MTQKRDNTRNNVVVWQTNKKQDIPASNRGLRIVNQNPVVRVENKLLTATTNSISTTMKNRFTQNKSSTMDKSSYPNPSSGKVQSTQKFSSVKIRAVDHQEQDAINNQQKSMNYPPSNIIPAKNYREIAQLNSIVQNQPSAASSKIPRFDNRRSSTSRKNVSLNDVVDTGDDVTIEQFSRNQMLVYADVNPESQDEEMNYDNIEILEEDLLLEEAVEQETYYSSDFEDLNDSAKKMIDDDQNNNSSNYSNNSTEGREPLENTEEIIDRRIKPINQKDVGVCRNVPRNVCSDRCNNVNRIILHKLNEIIEILNASHYKVGKANVFDFSRLEKFPLQSMKAVEDFEKKLKEDESLLELYKTKIGRIGGNNPETAVRNALKIVLTDEVAVRYSWTGMKKTIKISQHKIVDGIIETIMKSANTTLTELQNAAKEWFRHAGDRVRYQQKKEFKAMEK